MTLIKAGFSHLMLKSFCEFIVDLVLMALLGFVLGIGCWLGWGLVQFLADLAGGV